MTFLHLAGAVSERVSGVLLNAPLTQNFIFIGNFGSSRFCIVTHLSEYIYNILQKKMRSRSPKSTQLYKVPAKYLCKLDINQSISAEASEYTSFFFLVKI